MVTDMTNRTYPRINSAKPAKVLSTKCDRCGGDGIFSAFHGTCYRCGGNGIDPTYRDFGFPVAWTDEECQAWSDKRDARLEANRAKRAAKARAKKDAMLAANTERFPVLADMDAWLRSPERAEGDCLPAFFSDIRLKAFSFELSEKQGEAITTGWPKHLAERAERAEAAKAKIEAAGTVPTGRSEVIGQILSTKFQETQWGSTKKMLLSFEAEDGPVKIWGSVPDALRGGNEWADGDSVPTWTDRADVGDTVRFTATLSRSDDDPSFGFFKRPAKAEMVARAAQPSS